MIALIFTNVSKTNNETHNNPWDTPSTISETTHPIQSHARSPLLLSASDRSDRLARAADARCSAAGGRRYTAIPPRWFGGRLGAGDARSEGFLKTGGFGLVSPHTLRQKRPMLFQDVHDLSLSHLLTFHISHYRDMYSPKRGHGEGKPWRNRSLDSPRQRKPGLAGLAALP